jgi:N,N'-diacetyllegionaminate synthase
MESKFQSLIHIEGRAISRSDPVFIIAEIGVNHNGDLDLAREMIRSAKECGVDCIKFQTFRTEEFMASRGVKYNYSSAGRTVSEDMYEMFARLELPASWHSELFEYSRKMGLIPLTSVADPISVGVAESAGASAYKLSSEDLINLPLIEFVASKGKPLILSTGMADEQELDDALAVLLHHNLRDIVLLHCVSVYPTPDDEVRLGRMLALSNKTGSLIGYSDHSMGITASIAAVSLGACVIEKHFTLDRNLEGPDQALSSDPSEMKQLVREIRRIETMRGLAIETISPSKSELLLRSVFRRSLVASEDLPKGTKISKDHLGFQRAGTEGLRYRDIDTLLNKTLKHSLSKGAPILPSDLL